MLKPDRQEPRSRGARRGQVALYLLMSLVAIVILTLMNVDTFIAYHTKMQVENAGDAAALAAARSQGELLNDIGRLNIEHIIALLDGNVDVVQSFGGTEQYLAKTFDTDDNIELLQRRLALLGPVKESLHYADLAARKNGMKPREDFGELLRDHADYIRKIYHDASGGAWDPFPPSYGDEEDDRSAWLEYADAIYEAVPEGGIACGPDNVEFYHASGGHLLLNRQFYYAIKGETWCWFHFNCEEFFYAYTNRWDWPPLPPPTTAHTENSEIFSLHLKAEDYVLADDDPSALMTTSELFEAIIALSKLDPSPFSGDLQKRIDARARSLFTPGNSPAAEIARSNEIIRVASPQKWFVYDNKSTWRQWSDFDDLGLPMLGSVRPEYNVRGCSAICRTIKEASSTALSSDTSINWCAAAKPFGCGEPLIASDSSGNGQAVCTRIFRNLVTPCFNAVRLVAIDSVGGRDLTTADASWINHIRRHLIDWRNHTGYLVDGSLHDGCGWCSQIRKWDDFWWREKGKIWLGTHQCQQWGGGTGGSGSNGGSGGGGTAHGH